MRGIWVLGIFSFGAFAGECPKHIAEEADHLKVAAVQYRMGRPANTEAWLRKVESTVRKAAAQGARVVLLPELISIEGMALLDPNGENAEAAIRELSVEWTPRFQGLFARLAQELKITVIGGSWPESKEDGRYQNTVFVYGPDGYRLASQRKNHLTAGEKNYYKLDGAEGGAEIFTLPGGITAAIAICFDSEFPNFLPAFSDPIPEVIFVPSMTEDDFGRFRVARSASARAVEFHAYVVVTGTTGGDPADPVLGAHVGQAKFFSPSDKKFPAPGLLAEGTLNGDDIVVYELDLATLRESRKVSTTFPVKQLHEGWDPESP